MVQWLQNEAFDMAIPIPWPKPHWNTVGWAEEESPQETTWNSRGSGEIACPRSLEFHVLSIISSSIMQYDSLGLCWQGGVVESTKCRSVNNGGTCGFVKSIFYPFFFILVA